MRIGWIGTGVMGLPMCGHLIDAGHELFVYTRTRERLQPLLERGVTVCESPADVAKRCETVFTMVGFPSDVHDVYLGPQGVLSATRSGMLLIDMTTTRPSLAREIAEAAGRLGATALDAPVSGGDVGARKGTLSIMVGGDAAGVERARPLLECMGNQIVHHGPAGAGQDTKMCNQIVIAGTMIGVCESLLYGQRAGLDLRRTLESIKGGAAGCWSLDNLAPRVLDGNFEPGFFVEHFVKDMGMALEECRRMQLALPGLALVHQLYVALEAQGMGRKGTHALYLVLDALSRAASVDA